MGARHCSFLNYIATDVLECAVEKNAHIMGGGFGEFDLTTLVFSLHISIPRNTTHAVGSLGLWHVHV